jgi:HTH-type transcriptional regulator/antitoxin HigA
MQTVNAPVIRTREDLQEALDRAAALFNAADGTPERDELEVLVTLIEAYERRYAEIATPAPAQVLRVLAEDRHLTLSDFVSVLGTEEDADAALNGSRPISADEALELHRRYGVPVDLLLS